MQPSNELVAEFARIARVETIKELRVAQSGHPGSSLSIMDVLACLYFGGGMNHSSKDLGAADRDHFFLSQGHAAPGLYACLALAGYFPREELATLRLLGSRLQGHVKRGSLPGVEASAGSLGQGLNFATGVAMGERLRSSSNRVYVMTSDGEQQEGSHWEGVMFAASQNLRSITLFVDVNRNQINGPTHDIQPVMDELGSKYRAFGWDVHEIDGHSIAAIRDAISSSKVANRPTAIVCETLTGKGVSYMEGDYHWHHGVINDDKFLVAMHDLGETVSADPGTSWMPGSTDVGRLFSAPSIGGN